MDGSTLETSGSNQTWLCTVPVSGTSLYRLEVSTNSDCLTYQSSDRHIVTGSCSGTAAEWNIIDSEAYSYDNAVEFQNWGNKACIYQGSSRNSPVTYNPCKDQAGVTGDEWEVAAI